MAYSADGKLERLTLVNAETGNQVTRWIYGTTTDDSEIARSDLLRAKIYPLSDDEADPIGDGFDDAYQRIEYTYNRQGQILTMVDPNGTKHEYGYDDLGRPEYDEIPTFASGVDQTVRRIGTQYDNRGLVSKVTSYDYLHEGTGNILNEVGYEYDDFGQLSKYSQAHSRAVDGSTPAVSYGYADASNGSNTARRTSTTYPDGRQIDLSYGAITGDADDLLSRVSSLEINGESGKGVAYTYVGLARYVKIAYDEPDVDLTYIKEAGSPVGDAGDPYTGYDRFGRTVEMRWQTTGATPELRDGYQWGYDRSSNRTWRENLVEAADELDEHYGYDALNQVTDYTKGNLNINRSAIGGIPGEEQTFTYDPTGNWERYTTVDDGTETLDQTRVHNQDNQLTQIDGSNTGILYDKTGNALKTPPDKTGDWDEYYELTWDGWNRLVEIADKDGANVATYQYDGAARRTTKTVSGTTTHFYYNDQWRPVEEREDASTSASRQYLWGVREGHRDELILRDRDTDGNGSLDERLYCLMDYYNPTSVVNTSGEVQERYGFTAFGLRTIMDADWAAQSASSYAFDFGFHGQFLDEESGYYDYGYRYYSPQLGRWINRDPIGEEGGVNLYAFVANSPQNGNDRLGLKPFTVAGTFSVVKGLRGADADARMIKWNAEPKVTFKDDSYYKLEITKVEAVAVVNAGMGNVRHENAHVDDYKKVWEKFLEIVNELDGSTYCEKRVADCYENYLVKLRIFSLRQGRFIAEWGHVHGHGTALLYPVEQRKIARQKLPGVKNDRDEARREMDQQKTRCELMESGQI